MSWSPSDECDVECVLDPADECAFELDDIGSAVTVFFFPPDDVLDFDVLDFDVLDFDGLDFFAAAMGSTYLSPGQA